MCEKFSSRNSGCFYEERVSGACAEPSRLIQQTLIVLGVQVCVLVFVLACVCVFVCVCVCVCGVQETARARAHTLA